MSRVYFSDQVKTEIGEVFVQVVERHGQRVCEVGITEQDEQATVILAMPANLAEGCGRMIMDAADVAKEAE